MADMVDPFAGVKLLAGTYGIPPEVVDQVVGAIFGIASNSADRARAAEIAALMGAASDAVQIGQTEIANALILEVRDLLGLSDGGSVSDVTPGEGATA